MGKLVTALFKSDSDATRAVEDLSRHGYTSNDISIVAPHLRGGRAFLVNECSKAPEGLAMGAAIGGVIGALLLGLTSVGFIGIPALNFFAAGQFIGMLLGFAAGALFGGLIGGLIGLTMPEHEAEMCRDIDYEKNGILVGVFTSDAKRAEEAQRLFGANYAEHIKVEGLRSEQKKAA